MASRLLLPLRDGVHFEIDDLAGVEVSCRISYAALSRRAGVRSVTVESALDVFEQHRAAIEQEALAIHGGGVASVVIE